MRIVFIYTPGHNFLWFTPGQLPKAMVTADRKLSFMYAPGQGHLDCSCPYLCTPTDEDSVQHSLSLICPWTAIPKAMVTPDRSLISCTHLDKGVKTVTAHPNRWGQHSFIPLDIMFLWFVPGQLYQKLLWPRTESLISCMPPGQGHEHSYLYTPSMRIAFIYIPAWT